MDSATASTRSGGRDVVLRVRVCKLADVVDGELRAFAVRGVTWPVIVTRVEGKLVACQGVCPHEDVPLADGYLFGETIVCSAHAYVFDLRTGKCPNDAGLELRR